MTRTDLVILRPWRDGSVHAEVPTTTFHSDDDVVATHAYDSKAWPRFTTLCGEAWFGKASASGWRHPEVVDCDRCRRILLGEEPTAVEAETAATQRLIADMEADGLL